MRPELKNKSGFALLLVILIIAILGAMVSELLFGARIEAELLANHRNGLKARYIGRSAVNAYKYLIETNLLSPDTSQNLLVLSQWVGFGGGLQNIEGGEMAEALLGMSEGPYDPDPEGPLRGQWSVPLPTNLFELDGTMHGRMVSERGKLNLNALVKIVPRDRSKDLYDRKQYDRLLVLFQLLEIDPEEAMTCLDGIVDWIDGEMGAEARGAEEDYYRTLETPYYPRNNYLKSVDEIRLVKGCTPEIVERVKDFITVYPEKWSFGTYNPDGRVDPALAPKPVLMAVLMTGGEEDETVVMDTDLVGQIAEEIYTKAVEKCGVTVSINESGGAEINNVSLLTGREVQGVIAGRLPGNFDFYEFRIQDPQHYQVKAYGEVNGVYAGVEAIIKDSKEGLSVVSWHEE